MGNIEKKQESKSLTASEKFMARVSREFHAAVGTDVQWTPYQKKLATNIFLKCGDALQGAEAKRLDRQDAEKITPYTWDNVNAKKLALDTVHRVNLGLDAMIENHIQAIPYWNSSKGLYDINLMIGFRGKDHYRREMAMEKPIDIIYDLVYANDDFMVEKRGLNSQKDYYIHNIPEPFDRGEVIGGFGYIMYENEMKNKLVIVSERDFIKRKNKARTQSFWKEWPEEMRLKTVVHITTSHLPVDPKKVNASYHYVEAQEKMEAYEDVDLDEDYLVDISADETERKEEPLSDLGKPETKGEPDDLDKDHPFNYTTKHDPDVD